MTTPLELLLHVTCQLRNSLAALGCFAALKIAACFAQLLKGSLLVAMGKASLPGSPAVASVARYFPEATSADEYGVSHPALDVYRWPTCGESSRRGLATSFSAVAKVTHHPQREMKIRTASPSHAPAATTAARARARARRRRSSSVRERAGDTGISDAFVDALLSRMTQAAPWLLLKRARLPGQLPHASMRDMAFLTERMG